MTGYAQTVGGTIEERLRLRVLEVFGELEGETGDRQEILYVLAGSGTLELAGETHDLEPDSGVLLLPGEEYAIVGDLRLVAVDAPADGAIERERVVSRFADRDEERADAKRTFRVLHQGELTQFIGIVEPCRAPDHSHPYDEVGYIVEGAGIAHIGGDQVSLRAGSCFYLPPGCVHCIENTGPGVMRIMGVFFPAGSPKQRSYDAAGELTGPPSSGCSPSYNRPVARHTEAMKRVAEAVLRTPGDADTGLRARVEAYAASLGGREGPVPELPDDLRPYVEKVASNAYKVVDADIARLREAGYSEDAIFELTLAAALGAAQARLEAGLAAMV